jgi:hypothetical protein
MSNKGQLKGHPIEHKVWTVLELLAMPAAVPLLAGAFLWSVIKYCFTKHSDPDDTLP